ncbi:MAG: hypothetical protein OXU70_03100 [Gammaproteobacteria bacterium]|nr:hypothetical protein [Gammaproteobacteria bacterium]
MNRTWPVLPPLLLALLAAGEPARADAGGDRDALLRLHAEAGGESWHNDTNWGSALELGAWHGVRTDADGRVTGLNLEGNGLTGRLPPEIGDLVRLESLVLSFNDLEEAIPPEIAGLERLQRLDLSRNGITGEIPDELAGLGALRELTLEDNRLSGAIPASMGTLNALRVLNLRSNRLSGDIPPQLGDLKALEKLILGDNRLRGFIPGALGQLAELRELTLSWNRLGGEVPPELGSLAKLEWLALAVNGLAGALPPELGNLSNLRFFDVSSNLLTGEIPAWLADKTKLEALRLAYNDFSGEIPPFLGYLPLFDLALTGNRLTGEIPDDLGRLNRMGELTFGGNRLTGALPRSLIDLEVHNLDIGGNDLCVNFDDGAMKRWLRSARQLDGRLANCPNPHPVYLVQSVQSFDSPVTLVAGRPALLRVFLSSAASAGEPLPAVKATFHDAAGEVAHVAEIPAGGRLRRQITEGHLNASANAEIPGRVIQPGVELVVEVGGDLPELPSRIPADDRILLDVERLPPLELTLVPLVTAQDPSSAVDFVDEVAALGAKHPALQPMLDLLPVGGVEIEVHEPIRISNTWTYDMLRVVTAARRIEAGRGYWQGVLGPASVPGGLKQGLAWLDEQASYSDPYGLVMAHEVAHNMTVGHAPCGGATGADWYFPNRRARIGAWGWNRAYGILVPPAAFDNMSYCDPKWTGEYSFSRALTYRMGQEAAASMPTVEQAPRKEPTLLLWGGVDEQGAPYLRSSLLIDAVPEVPPPGDDYRISGRNADGTAFSLSFDMPALPDAGDERAFVITLPVSWSGSLESIRLESRDRAATLDLETQAPMTILRNSATGQVRAILERPAADAVRSVPGTPNLEVFESFGIAVQ